MTITKLLVKLIKGFTLIKAYFKYSYYLLKTFKNKN